MMHSPFRPIRGNSHASGGARVRPFRMLIPLLALLLPAVAGAAPAAVAERAEAKTMPAGEAAPTPLRTRQAQSTPVPRSILIEKASASAVAREVPGVAAPGAPLKTGFRREIAATRSTADTAAQLDWQATATGGWVAGLHVSSPGARALRLGILVKRLPEVAVFRFFAPGDLEAQEISGATVLAALKRNLMAGDASERGQTYWSPPIDGETIGVEVELPAGVPLDALEIAIPALSHLVKAPLDSSAALEQARVGESGSCNVDATCYPAWANTAKAVAKMSYVESGASYECSGTLIADNVSTSLVPYFISANHCIGDQTAASTLVTYWFYRSTACNSGTLNPSSVSLPGGAELLYASGTTDTSFMRLLATPPAGVQFSAWSSAAPTLGTTGTSLHHPFGDLQKIAIGALDAYATCTEPAADGGFSCTDATADTATFVNVTFTTGTAESGSSGSGLHISEGSQQYLIGTYLGGSSACSNLSGSNRYGRFDLPYATAMRQWLSGYQFPSLGQAVDYPGFTWTSGGNGLFYSQSSITSFGGTALQSPVLNNSQSAFLGTTVTGPGSLSFYWRVSSEAGYDFLGVYLDDTRQAQISGEVGWTKTSVSIPAGSHTVKWIYAKDNLVKAGSDAGWIDRVEFAAAPVTPVTGLWAIDAEVNGQPGRGFTLEVQNGVLVLTIFGYDASGADAFYQAAAAYSNNSFSGTLNRYSGGTTFGGPFKSASVAGSAGTVTMSFTDSTHGTITLPGEAAKAFSKFTW